MIPSRSVINIDSNLSTTPDIASSRTRSRIMQTSTFLLALFSGLALATPTPEPRDPSETCAEAIWHSFEAVEQCRDTVGTACSVSLPPDLLGDWVGACRAQCVQTVRAHGSNPACPVGRGK
ncbi:hypothetical protein PT974_05625 [Cladobotryum mycophilum]|uniref:Uncharacterized protein n=1 Tax=Cladobotryum mycophilum TaxID=491253 RepID=A0ABR0SJM7_9HYPO